jgi:hypothetical protein
MTENQEQFTGGCACGAVRYQSSAAPAMAAQCHCRNCQKASGTGHGSHILVPKTALEVTGEVRYHESLADSGNTVSRGFCPTCGAPVLSKNSGFHDMMVVSAGSLDDPALFRPGMIVYTERAPAWDRMDPALPRFAGMPEGV